MAYATIPASSSSGSCPVTLIQTQNVTLADTNTLTFSGLSGDTDGIYELEGWGPAGANCTIRGGTLSCNFNGTTTNQAWESNFNLSTSAGNITWNGSSGSNSALVAYEAAAGKGWHFYARIYPKTGVDRRIKWNCSASHSATAASNQYFEGMSYWYETITPVTSLVLVDGTHNFFGIGSVVALRKLALS
jgi:hypothetical protein